MIAKSFFHFIAFYLHLTRPNTQTTKKEREVIAHYASNAVCAVEIGVFEGYNTALIARSISPTGQVYGIDPFYKGKLGISWQKIIANTYLKRQKIFNRIKLIEDKSEHAYNQIPNAPDFIFVDGDHSLKGISTDWGIYSKLLGRNGIIALHDTFAPQHQSWKAEMDSVKYFNSHIRMQPGFELLETVDSLSILRKL